MKKKALILLSLSATLLLSGCFLKNVFGGKKNSENESNISQSDSEESSSTYFIDPERKKDQVYYFYLDYSHSEEPFYQMEWYSLIPLGSCPAECQLTDKDAADPLFPHFLCWSEYSSSIDDSHAWDFSSNYKAGKEVKLYGIWVSDE